MLRKNLALKKPSKAYVHYNPHHNKHRRRYNNHNWNISSISRSKSRPKLKISLKSKNQARLMRNLPKKFKKGQYHFRKRFNHLSISVNGPVIDLRNRKPLYTPTSSHSQSYTPTTLESIYKIFKSKTPGNNLIHDPRRAISKNNRSKIKGKARTGRRAMSRQYDK